MKFEEVYNSTQQAWILENWRSLKSIMDESGRVSLDMKVQIELYNRRLLAMDKKKTA